MKKIITLIALLLASFVGVLAQDKPNQVISGQLVYNRENVYIDNLGGERIAVDKARDSVGGGVSWDWHVNGSPFFMGMETKVTFHNKKLEDVVIPLPGGATAISVGQTSKVAKADFHYRAGFADRSGTFQPGVAAMIGLKNGNFAGVAAGPGGLTSTRRGSSFDWGGTAWNDFCFGATKRKCLRVGASVTKAFNRDTDGLDVTPYIGFAIKFGGK